MEGLPQQSKEQKRWKKVRDVFSVDAQLINPPNAAHRRWNTVMENVSPRQIPRRAAFGDPRPVRTFDRDRHRSQTKRPAALDALPSPDAEAMHNKLAAFRRPRSQGASPDSLGHTSHSARIDSPPNRPSDSQLNGAKETPMSSAQHDHRRRNTVIGVVTTMAQDLCALMDPSPIEAIIEDEHDDQQSIMATTGSVFAAQAERTHPERSPVQSRKSSGEELTFGDESASAEDSSHVEGGGNDDGEAAMATTRATRETRNDVFDETQARENERTDTFPAEVTSVEEWGSAEEVESLNREILSCLEIEGIAPPPNLFVESVKNFRSVGHYYVNAMKLLDAPGIDLFASLSSRFGENHALVNGMREVLAEMSNVTFITREPTDVREERHRAGEEIRVPGLKQFSDECRSWSWVVRNNPLPPRRREEDDARHRARLEPIAASVGGCSYRAGHRGMPKQEEGQIVCPGLPVSFDGYEQPPHRPQASPHKSTPKKPLLNRLMSCLCFAS